MSASSDGTAPASEPAVASQPPSAIKAAEESPPQKPSLVVIGDIQRDMILVTRPTSDRVGLDDEPCPGIADRPLIQLTRDGGTWLLHDTIRFALKDTMDCYTYAPFEKLALTEETRVLCPRSLVALGAVKKSPKSEPNDIVYRIDMARDARWVEDPGLKRVAALPDFESKLNMLFTTCLESTADILHSNWPRMIVVYDRARLPGDGFRVCGAKMALNKFALKNPHFDKAGGGVLIWHRTHPFDFSNDDELWRFLRAHFDHTVAVVKYECLSKAGVRINQDSSVEQLIEDCVKQERHPLLVKLRRCRHLILVFRDGVLHWDNTDLGHVEYHYCPNIIDELINPRDGQMSGSTIIMLASIAYALGSMKPETPRSALDEVKEGIKLGTVLAALHYRRGFSGPELYVQPKSGVADEHQLSDENNFPYHLRQLFVKPGIETTDKKDSKGKGAVVEERMTKKLYLLASLTCETRVAQGGRLSRARIYFKELEAKNKRIEDKIAEVVCKGLEAATTDAKPYELTEPWFPKGEVGCSVAEFGKQLKTTDRKEIENYMALHTLISNYLADKKSDKPFSIATFGTPGSGKSFAIKQIVESIDPDAARAPLEFNVSQFAGVHDLAGAFHQAHDRSTQGNALVIFDEFDASLDDEPLGWLKFFLAPMQDGVFRAEGTLYHVGRAIFLFTGGTKSTFKDFYTKRKKDSEFRAAKGPDFVSRLRGYMDIPKFSAVRKPDNEAMFRRAAILRSILERKVRRIIDDATQVAKIDREVINAFVRTRNYEHEVRSMEAIVEMSKMQGGAFRKSSLPTPEQLSLHVNPKEFLGHLDPD